MMSLRLGSIAAAGAVALAFAFGSASGVAAATCPAPPDPDMPRTQTLTSTTAGVSITCVFFSDGNDQNPPNAAIGTFLDDYYGVDGFTQNKSDDADPGLLSGFAGLLPDTIDFDFSIDLTGLSNILLSFKVGNQTPEVAMFEISGANLGLTAFNWVTAPQQGGGLSHATLRYNTAVIPLPAAGWLLLGGLGALAAVRRRRKAA